ncbi:MAG: ABC transporter ATP-binding protein [Acidobacteria bacterium]|nr:MAG: ABC transporter ATP-binding protein [Acidobacteriota bacterium]
MTAEPNRIVFTDGSKFYGEVLGVNKINLKIGPGITSLVGPNGSGKTTLMNLMTGLIRPTRGEIEVLGTRTDAPETFYSMVGYCTQFDTFPKGVTGFGLIYSVLRLHGRTRREAEEQAWQAIEQVHMTDAAHRRVAAYSKGMRQRIKLALAVAHHPTVLVLDEPLNGLDPMARAESIALFEKLAEEGLFVIISSHILHEVDLMSDCVVMMSNGYVVAEGDIQEVREEMSEHPIGIRVRCDRPALLASRAFSENHVVEVRIEDDGAGVLLRSRSVDQLYALVNRVVLEEALKIEGVTPVDEDVHSVYSYLIGSNGAGRL